MRTGAVYLLYRSMQGVFSAYFVAFFSAFVFSALAFGLLVFPGGTQPQFSFLANWITPFPPDSRFLSLWPAASDASTGDGKTPASSGGASESNNHAIKGIFFARRDGGDHIITTAVEHPAVLNPCRFLEKIGAKTTVLPVDRFGRVDADDVGRTGSGTYPATRGSVILISLIRRADRR